ncbi:MAG: SnoaL-like domain-containing protein [Phycisphaerales bacterium]
MAKKKTKSKPAKKPGAKKDKTPKAAPTTTMIKTGKGPSPREVGERLVALANAGKIQQVEDELWSPNIVSIEGFGQAFHGRKAVEAKNRGWYDQNDVAGFAAEGPFVGATGFAIKMKIQVREKATGKITDMNEIGVYTVLNGKIVQEEFMYGA